MGLDRSTRHIEDLYDRIRTVLDYPDAKASNYRPALEALDEMARLARPDDERLVRLEEFLAAYTAVEEGITSFELHGSTVDRLRRALEALTC